MAKSKKETVHGRKRNSLTNRGNRIVKASSRPVSAVSTTSSLPAANIRVVVRVRPPNQREQDENNRYTSLPNV